MNGKYFTKNNLTNSELVNILPAINIKSPALVNILPTDSLTNSELVNILPKTVVNKPDFKEKYADSIAYFVDRSFESPSDDAGIKFDGDKSETANVVSSKFGLYTTSYYNRAGKPIVRYLTGGLRGEPIENPIPHLMIKR